MAQHQCLDIQEYRGEQVPNEFLRQREDTAHVAIFLPGVGYTCDMPLFYYAEILLLELGADVLRVEYAYSRRPDYRNLTEAERVRWLLTDATAAYCTAINQRDYRRVTLIGKSLGTIAMAHLVQTEASLDEATTVWLTPLIREEGVREPMRRHRGPSMIAIGSADPHYEPTILDDLKTATDCTLVTIPGANHSLDIPGDVSASVGAVGAVIVQLKAFLGAPQGETV